MPDRGTGLLTDRLIRMVEKILAIKSISRQVSPDDELTQLGLTSLDMVGLLLGAEAEFDVMIPAAAISPENFRSISTIATMIAALISGNDRP